MSKKVYLDYAATTPVDPRVITEIIPYFGKKFGNTMSFYVLGQEAKRALEASREVVADFIKSDAREIIFTGSATESNNTALKGVAFANRKKGKHIIISQIEHPSVLESAGWLEKQGFEITKLPVDRYGLIKPNDVRKAIRKGTILVSVIHANNEIGTIEPIQEVGKVCREKGVYFHTDASQSLGRIPINVNAMNVDLLSASSHKIYGSKGAAILFIRKGTRIEPLLHGGGHEFGLRSSTVNVASVVGFAEALKIAGEEMVRENKRLAELRDLLIREILRRIKDTHLNGHPTKRLPNNINISFSFVEGESVIMQLDSYGISASTGSACSSEKLEPSHVLLAIGLRPEEAHGSLRLSLGRWTKREDINYVIRVLPQIVKKLRRISPFKSYG